MSGKNQDELRPKTDKESPKEQGVENEVDEAMEETFPASDPPSFNPGITGDPGNPDVPDGKNKK